MGYMMVIITALQQLLQLMYAVPQIFKMCGKGSWATINDRYDPRVSENIDGKSTLRLYLHVMNSVVRLIGDQDADKVLDQWVQEVYVTKWQQEAKNMDIIEGKFVQGSR